MDIDFLLALVHASGIKNYYKVSARNLVHVLKTITKSVLET